jgi:hypothetical protein
MFPLPLRDELARDLSLFARVWEVFRKGYSLPCKCFQKAAYGASQSRA